MTMRTKSDDLKLDLFEDANFSGLHSLEDKLDLVSVKSITGILLNFGGFSVC